MSSSDIHCGKCFCATLNIELSSLKQQFISHEEGFWPGSAMCAGLSHVVLQLPAMSAGISGAVFSSVWSRKALTHMSGASAGVFRMTDSLFHHVASQQVSSLQRQMGSKAECSKDSPGTAQRQLICSYPVGQNKSWPSPGLIWEGPQVCEP